MSTRILRGRAGALVSTALGALWLNLLAAAPASAVCVGDCNGDGMVAINELITMINIALGNATVGSCPALCTDNTLDISCLISAVNNALEGCPATPTPTGID